MNPTTRFPTPAAAGRRRRGAVRALGSALAVLALGLPVTASAAAFRVIASDATGVTLRLDVPGYALQPDDVSSRSVPVVDGMVRTDAPGRPRLPMAATLIAIPPGTRAVARVIAAGPEQIRDATPIAIADKPDFAPDPALGLVPTLVPQEAIRDGAWPSSPVRLGEIFTMRDRRFVPLQVVPFRYNEDGAQLTLTTSLTVRVDFVGAGAGATAMLRSVETDDAPDPQFDAIFATQVTNWEVGRAWRARRPQARDGSLLRPRGGATALGGAAVNGFDESEPEVRVRVDTTGVYGISYDSLAVYGYPAGVPVAEVSVHRHEFLEDQTPPYETIDLPCEVDDNDGNGTFGPGDRVVVWVWDWAQRSRADNPQRIWGDAEVVYVTRKTGALRIPHRSGWLGRNDLVPLASYPRKRHYEQNKTEKSFPTDTLVDRFTWESFTLFCTPSTFPFETNDLDPAMGGSVTVAWMGVNTSQHITWAHIRNGSGVETSVHDSTVWNGNREDIRTAAVPPGAFSEGNTNILKLWGKTNAGDVCATAAPLLAGLNWFDVTFWRRFNPIKGYLACNSAAETGDFEIRAGPFVNAPLLRAYDVTDSLNPQRLDGVDISSIGPDVYLRLQDTASPTVRRQYVVFDTPKSPAPGAMSAVTRYRIYDHTAGDYLMVVPERFLAGVQPLVNLHTSQGLRVVVAPLEGLQDEFNGGRKSAYGIKRFIRYGYNNWNARFVLLVGDGSEDPRGYLQDPSPDVVPTRLMQGPVPVQFLGTDYLNELVPSDFWYVWCMNCAAYSAGNLKPDLSIGRLPVNTNSQLAGVVSKIVNYEDRTGDQSWREKILLMADDAYSGATTFGGTPGGSAYCRRPSEVRFRLINENVADTIRAAAGLAASKIELFNLSYYLPNRPGEFTTSGASDTCRNDVTVFQTRARATATPELFSRLNEGRFWWSYQGHANEYLVSHEYFYINEGTSDDKSRLTNVGKPFLFTAFSCHPNSFGRALGGDNDPQRGPPFGEDLVKLPNSGAIASWASTGYEALPSDAGNHIHLQLASAMFVNPPRDEYLGDRGSRLVLGEVIYSALLANFAARQYFPSERDVSVTYTLLGDPATRLSIGAPEAIVTANTQPVTSGQQIRLSSPGDTLRLDASLVSNVRLDSLKFERVDAVGTTPIWSSSDATVPAGLTVSPAFPDTASATSRYGGRRFALTWHDQLQPESYRYVFHTWDRYGVRSDFEAVFSYQVILRVGGQAIADGDFVSPNADFSLLVLSPKPLAPQTDLTLRVNGQVQAFTAAAANGDVSGREWLLTWTHAAYPSGENNLDLEVAGGATSSIRFRVAEAGAAVRLDNAMAFPNPFDDDYLRALSPGHDVATVFSFDLVSATPADVTLRVYTISGRLIYQRTERRLDPRWHQLEWSGRDAEGSPIANGVYFYKLLASNGTSTAVHEGRLVKLRRPRRSAVPEPAN